MVVEDLQPAGDVSFWSSTCFPFHHSKKPFRPEHRRRERDSEEAGSVINPEGLSDQVHHRKRIIIAGL